MLRTLEGRLEWEKTARGISVKIPARRGSAFGLFGPIIGVWLLFASFQYASMVFPNTFEDARAQVLWIVIDIFGVSVLILLFWAAWAFTSDTLVTLDETQMKIQRRVLGIELATRNFSTTEVHNFRFIPPSKFRLGRSGTDIRTSKIEFHARSKPQYFAEGVTQSEAQVLIEQMVEVFKFPEFLAPPVTPIRM
jgi:hypothetical protein